MSFILEINATLVFDTVEDARKIGQTVGTVLGSDSGIKIRDTRGFIRSDPNGDVYGQKNVALYDPTFKPAGLTYRKQEMEVLAGGMVNKFVKAFDADPAIFTELIKLDAGGKTWEVNYPGLIRDIRVAYSDDYTEQLSAFKAIIQDALAQAAIGKISFK